METVLPMLEKKLDGFGEYFGLLCHEKIGGAGITNRAVGGVVESTLILCIPGSLSAVSLVMEMERIIIPQLDHMAWEVAH